MLVGSASAHNGDLGSGLAVSIFLAIDLALAAHLGAQVVAKGVHATHAHAVQAARHLVRPLIKLTTGVEHGHDHFERALVELLVFVHGNTAAVVAHGDTVVGANGDLDAVAKTGECLVDRVVHNLAHEVMETLDARVANVH